MLKVGASDAESDVREFASIVARESLKLKAEESDSSYSEAEVIETIPLIFKSLLGLLKVEAAECDIESFSPYVAKELLKLLEVKRPYPFFSEVEFGRIRSGEGVTVIRNYLLFKLLLEHRMVGKGWSDSQKKIMNILLDGRYENTQGISIPLREEILKAIDRLKVAQLLRFRLRVLGLVPQDNRGLHNSSSGRGCRRGFRQGRKS